MHRLTIRLPEGLLAALNERALENGVPWAQEIRRALEAHLNIVKPAPVPSGAEVFTVPARPDRYPEPMKVTVPAALMAQIQALRRQDKCIEAVLLLSEHLDLNLYPTEDIQYQIWARG